MTLNPEWRVRVLDSAGWEHSPLLRGNSDGGLSPISARGRYVLERLVAWAIANAPLIEAECGPVPHEPLDREDPDPISWETALSWLREELGLG